LISVLLANVKATEAGSNKNQKCWLIVDSQQQENSGNQ